MLVLYYRLNAWPCIPLDARRHRKLSMVADYDQSYNRFSEAALWWISHWVPHYYQNSKNNKAEGNPFISLIKDLLDLRHPQKDNLTSKRDSRYQREPHYFIYIKQTRCLVPTAFWKLCTCTSLVMSPGFGLR